MDQPLQATVLPVLQAMMTPRIAPRLLANHLVDWDIHDLWQWVKANPGAVSPVEDA